MKSVFRQIKHRNVHGYGLDLTNTCKIDDIKLARLTMDKFYLDQ